MISNYLESFKNKTNDAISFPVTTFIEFICFTLQMWFATQRKDIEKCTTILSKLMEEDLTNIANEARTLNAEALSQFEFHFIDPIEGDCVVNLSMTTCDCASWQLIGIPCRHAVAADLERNVNIYFLCSPYYMHETWAECYKEAIPNRK